MRWTPSEFQQWPVSKPKAFVHVHSLTGSLTRSFDNLPSLRIDGLIIDPCPNRLCCCPWMPSESLCLIPSQQPNPINEWERESSSALVGRPDCLPMRPHSGRGHSLVWIRQKGRNTIIQAVASRWLTSSPMNTKPLNEWITSNVKLFHGLVWPHAPANERGKNRLALLVFTAFVEEKWKVWKLHVCVLLIHPVLNFSCTVKSSGQAAISPGPELHNFICKAQHRQMTFNLLLFPSEDKR